jgi:hypothetical protein
MVVGPPTGPLTWKAPSREPTRLASPVSPGSFVPAYDEHDAKLYRWTFDGGPLEAA